MFAGHHRAWIVFFLLVSTGVVLQPVLKPDRQTRLLRQAISARMNRSFGEAERLAREILRRWPTSPTALVIAGEAMAKNGRPEEALQCLQRVTPDAPVEYVEAQYQAGVRLIHMGRASEAEACLRRALELDPYHVPANTKLAVLLQTEGRTWEAKPHAEILIFSGECGRDQLLMIGGLDSMVIDDPPFTANCLHQVPDDQIVRLAEGRIALLRDDDAERAEEIFRNILRRHPEQMEALARLGEVLLERPERAPFIQWQATLPKVADLHPRTWFARGVWARRNGQPRAAARCFLEALRLHPNHASSNFQLSQVLIALGMAEEAKPFVERSRLLATLDYTVNQLQNLPDLELMRQVAVTNEQLGCSWEAIGWCYVARLLDPQLAWATEALATASYRLTPAGQFMRAESLPALAMDISQFPLPVWPELSDEGPAAETQSVAASNIQWVDVAPEAGLDFQYFNTTTKTYGPDHIMTAPGGGVGVIDYDCDGWPDLYFPQAGPWDQRGDQNPYVDRLFRNLGDGRFVDVTEQAGLKDGEFSGGVAIGDYNNDGYPDIYVVNIGENRLFQNMGDGTFRNVTAAAGCGGGPDIWSTSGAMVDLNGDGCSEIYSVNYVLLHEALARGCGQKGQAMGCAPTLFHFEQDRLFHNLGDGRFRDVTDEAGIRTPDGKGLSVLAADFTGTGRLDLFVANDTTPNLYFANQVSQPGQPLQFVESGVEVGVAMNANGQSQASMGLTVGDANGDQLADFYVGTFYHDSNTLFVQSSANTFADESRMAGLRDPTFKMLTFGTQFVDADLDGALDIFQANGHVDRSYDPSVPDLMPPQFLWNRGDGYFKEVTADSLGSYFQQECLGRGVAVIDFDRDGRPDLAVSHLDVPAALLANRTPDAGHHLKLKLLGRAGSRDAYGASVRVTAGGQVRTRLLVAGGGYMTANEHMCIVGLGVSERVERLEIRWPSGAEQVFEDVEADRELAVIEGTPQLFLVPK